MPPKYWRLHRLLADSFGAATVAEACRSVLITAEPRSKIMTARRAARDWRMGRLAFVFDSAMPERPAQPDRPILLMPRDMPRRGNGGSERNRIALLHALAHIEFVAIDLAFDLVGRFGAQMPRSFADDWMRVGAEEALHFALIDRRLRTLGSHYGALPAHDGLWQSAQSTADDLAARLAVVPMVLEARGLDVTPQTIDRLKAAGDERSARILARIAADEVNHVAAGTRWFAHLMNRDGLNGPEVFKMLVRRHFRGSVKPPFNDSARRQAGLTRDYYQPLAD